MIILNPCLAIITIKQIKKINLKIGIFSLTDNWFLIVNIKRSVIKVVEYDKVPETTKATSLPSSSIDTFPKSDDYFVINKKTTYKIIIIICILILLFIAMMCICKSKNKK